MTPLDFIKGGDHYNDPVGDHQISLEKPIRIFSSKGEWEVLSYYMGDNKQMYLDIQKVTK